MNVPNVLCVHMVNMYIHLQNTQCVCTVLGIFPQGSKFQVLGGLGFHLNVFPDILWLFLGLLELCFTQFEDAVSVQSPVCANTMPSREVVNCPPG